MHSDKLKNISHSLLEDGYSLKLTVKGNSMFPYLLSQETVKVEPLNMSNVSTGEIVVFVSGNEWVAHRLIRKDEKNDRYITKGDFCIHRDAPLGKEQIIGKIVSVYRNNKEVVMNHSYRKLVNKTLVYFEFMLPLLIRLLRKLRLIKIPYEYFHNS